jgi:hypothetical protein
MIQLADEHRHLALETRARTVLATCDRVEVTSRHDGAGDRATGFLAFGAEVFLVPAESTHAPGEPVTIVCRGPVGGLGVLKLLGRCDAPVTSAGLPALRRILDDHGHETGATTEIIPVLLDEVRLLLPATAGQHAQVIPLEVDRFHAAGPDPWVMAHGTAGPHLEECHQAELTALAARRVGSRPEAVVIRAVGPESMTLACLGGSGVTELRVDYGCRLAHPGEVSLWMRGAIHDHP